MILEGLKLMVIGMVIVYIFLVVLMVCVVLSSKIFEKTVGATPSTTTTVKDGDKDIVAVISAAIAAFRSKNK